MILRIMIWLYRSKHDSSFPKLMLLDEPDSHLHPSMTRQFFSVLSDLLVSKYAVRIIMTTHSPSTVALSPEGAVFEMSRASPRLQRSESREKTIGLLTAGLVVVSRGTRFAFVEGEDDADFYGTVRDILVDQGPRRDQQSIDPIPSLIFLPVSRGDGKERVGGGELSVQQWVEKMKAPPLGEMFRGIIDYDNGNSGSNRVFVTGRHSIENYLADPLVAFALLNDAGKAPSIAGLTITRGDEHLLRDEPQEILQKIIYAIGDVVTPAFEPPVVLDTNSESVEFTSGLKLNYPRWMLRHRGHDILQVYQKAFGGPKVISPPRLKGMIRRIRIIPAELATVLRNLQA